MVVSSNMFFPPPRARQLDAHRGHLADLTNSAVPRKQEHKDFVEAVEEKTKAIAASDEEAGDLERVALEAVRARLLAGSENFGIASPYDSVNSSKSQLEINAERKIKTIVKLKMDDEALNRRAAYYSQRAEMIKSTNDSKEQRVIEHCQKRAVDQEARYRQLLEEEATRNMIISERRASERMRLECVGDALQCRTSNAASHREKNQQAREERLSRKAMEDSEKLRRKARALQSVIESRYLANEKKSEKVAEHRAQYAELQEDRLRRIQEADAARASCIRERELAERQRCELASSIRQQSTDEAAEARRRMQGLMEERLAHKWAKDDEKLSRKYRHLEDESLRLQEQSRVREARLRKKRQYDALVEKVLAIAQI